MVKINGKDYPYDGYSISQAIEDLGLRKAHFVVEVDGEIVPSYRHEHFILQASHQVEVVTFVGGG